MIMMMIMYQFSKSNNVKIHRINELLHFARIRQDHKHSVSQRRDGLTWDLNRGPLDYIASTITNMDGKIVRLLFSSRFWL